jgi:thiol-disulfide isomerase/thioredoxin
VKFSSAFLFTALICSVWSCKPKDNATTSPEAPAAAAPAAPDPEPAPEATPAPTPEPIPQSTSPEKLDVGSKVSLEAVKAATWIQGTAPESFEPGLVYIFEAWATWCGPCIRIIPHMNELHKKYHDKGLRVYGMNVFEDDEEKVVNFVKKKGDEMTYPVA